MKSYKHKTGVTLVEMLIVVAVIAILASMAIGIAARIDNQDRERDLKSTFVLLESALREYYEYRNRFPDPNHPDYPAHSSSAMLYEQLYSIPGSRKILGKISNSLIRNNPDMDGAPEIYDSWGTVLGYRYDDARNNFPKLISAGPDKIPGNYDDITNK